MKNESFKAKGKIFDEKTEFNNLMRLSFYMKIRHTDFMLKIFCRVQETSEPVSYRLHIQHFLCTM
jgi:hypothetical protein